MLENELSEDIIRKLSSINSKYKIVPKLEQLIEDVYAFQRQLNAQLTTKRGQPQFKKWLALV